MILLTLIAAPLTGFATWAAARMVLELLAARGVMDQPNERSSHERPVPRGGGIAVMGLVLPSWLLLSLFSGIFEEVWPVALAALVLALLSFLDDVRGLHQLPRFAGHVAAVVLGLALLPADALLFDGWLPFWADRVVTGLAWVWFINLFNFMDGIDGITGMETVTVCGGLALGLLILAHNAGGDATHAPMAAVLAGAAAGFLVLNWHPAKLFLGDVGSVPLGYLLGWLLVWTACVAGLWWLALLLPLYYWADATTTLVRRGLRGEKVWRAHREHAYQIAVQAGGSHAEVVGLLAVLNAALIALAILALLAVLPGWFALGLGAVLTGAALWYLRRRYGKLGGL
jgi:UDP-N-acetylmuramyl pentapeptide phosphotransferase/UDP-N-acetylglucosamine-1-phosphate transferase